MLLRRTFPNRVIMQLAKHRGVHGFSANQFIFVEVFEICLPINHRPHLNEMKIYDGKS